MRSTNICIPKKRRRKSKKSLEVQMEDGMSPEFEFDGDMAYM